MQYGKFGTAIQFERGRLALDSFSTLNNIHQQTLVKLKTMNPVVITRLSPYIKHCIMF